MSKVSFRARALDATKPMPVYKAEEIPDLPDFAQINRSVPQMPTGMEKEEETEHHLQRALSAQQVYGTAESLVIPIPEIDDIKERHASLYKGDFKQPKQYVHVQAFGMDQEIPDYDMDSDDESWLDQQVKKMEITPLKFEQMMDRLEKGSGQQVVTLQEAKALLKEDDDLIISVYDYWLNKRLSMQHPLILSVKCEKRDGTTTNNPYVAFRRRSEKMQTRKNRKNDEVSYEKMLKLRRDISRSLTLTEMIKRREKAKKEMLQLTIEVLAKRFQMEDFTGVCLAEAEEERRSKPMLPLYPITTEWARTTPPVRKKREYKKRRVKNSVNLHQSPKIPHHHHHHPIQIRYGDLEIIRPDVYSSEDDALSPGIPPSDHEDENDPDGPFAFKRKKHCHYHAPLLDHRGNWPWYGSEDGGMGDEKYRYSLMSLPPPRQCIGFARRRLGRGGRVLVDRGFSPWDDALSQLDLSEEGSAKGVIDDYLVYIRDRKIRHYRPRSPVPGPCDDPSSPSSSSMPVISEFNLEGFQNHQQQLIQMQRDQQEQLLKQESQDSAYASLEQQNFSQNSEQLAQGSASSQELTLDSATAQFAASAVLSVVTSTQSQPSVSSNGAMTTSAMLMSRPALTSMCSAPMKRISPDTSNSLLGSSPGVSQLVSRVITSNGPIVDAKSVGYSTSPVTTVFQLNFPMISTKSEIMSTLSSPVSTVTPINSFTPNMALSVGGNSKFKLSSPIPREMLMKHEDVVAVKPLNNLAKDIVAMDVT